MGERPERYSDESLATMTLKRSGMAANEYIAAENWPNLSHRKKPRYVEMASASSKLPINRCALVRKEASAELSSSMEDRAVSVQQSLFEASIERADLLAKRIREISVEGSVRRLKAGCQQNGSGHRSELIPAGCHEVVALEVVRTATSGERRSVKVHLRVPLEGATLLTDCNSTPKTKAYGTPSRFSDAVYSAVNQLKPLMYTAPKADGGNDFYLDTDDRAIGLLTAPACGGMIFCTLSITVNGETVQLLPLPLPTPSSDDAGADAEGGRSSTSTEAGDSRPEFDQEEVSFLEKRGRTFYRYRSYTSEGGVEWIDVKDVLEFTFSDAATKEAIKKLSAGTLGVSVNERKRVHWMHEGRAKSGPGRVVTSRPNIHKLLWKFFDQRRSRRSWDEIVAKLFDENAPEEVVEGRNGEAEVQ